MADAATAVLLHRGGLRHVVVIVVIILVVIGPIEMAGGWLMCGKIIYQKE